MLKTHNIILISQDVTLRPLTKEDYVTLFKWNNNPDVLYYSEGDDVSSYSWEDMVNRYESVSQNALGFIIETGRVPIGECRLQKMNLPRILNHLSGDIRRIDIMIGETGYWHRGYGTKAVKLLLEYAFNVEGCDYLFACDIADFNEGSYKLFKNLGFSVFRTNRETGKAQLSYDLFLKNNNLNN